MCLKKIFLTFVALTAPLSSLSAATLLPAPEEKAREQLLEQIAGEWVAQGIYAVTVLGIPEYLDQGPIHYTKLAHLSDTEPSSLYRLLRMLSSQGIFSELPDKSFSHTEKSKLLSSQHPYSLHSLTIFYGGVIHQSWEGLLSALYKGTPGFEEHFGLPVFQYFKEQPEVLALFHAAMNEKSNAVIDSCLKNFDFGAFKSIYDIGGGKGHFLWKILEKHKGCSGLLFDLPEVIKEIDKPTSDKRYKLLAGNFFEEIPVGGDLYILKSILHDWDDTRAKTLLAKCHEAMSKNSQLMIVEPLLCERNTLDYAALMDVLMLNVTGGKERSLDDFQKLLEETHFTIQKVCPTATEFKMIIATKSLTTCSEREKKTRNKQAR